MAAADVVEEPDEAEEEELQAPESDLYGLVKKFCTLDSIQDLLRKYQREVPREKKGEVKISGDNKGDIVANLETAVDAEHVPIEEVYAMLQDAEENGRQHIFLFRPRTDAAKKLCQNGEAVAAGLFGSNWRTKKKFPNFELVPDTYTWADFRIGLPGKPNDWVAKLYGHEETVDFIREEERENNQFAKVYRRRPIRTICMARWNNNDLLEIRVPVSSAAKDAVRRRDIVWLNIRKGLDQGILAPWDLTGIRRKMLLAEVKAKEEVDAKKKGAELEDFECGDKQFLDEENNTATFNMQASLQLPTVANSTKTATNAYLKNKNCELQRLIVFWKKNELNGLKKPLRTLLGTTKNSNELVVFSRISHKALDYVTNQLRRFVD